MEPKETESSQTPGLLGHWLPKPPSGYKSLLPHGQYGVNQYVHYRSSLLNRDRVLGIHFPYGYDPAKVYPVFYLLHGVKASAEAWLEWVRADRILDNLIALESCPAAILVSPDCNLNDQDQPIANRITLDFDKTYREMTESILPFVNSRYPVRTDRDGSFIAGYSLGAREAMYTAFQEPDLFSEIGAFSTWTLRDYLGGSFDLGHGFPRLLSFPRILLTVGHQDQIRRFSEAVDRQLALSHIPHRFLETEGKHEYEVWSISFYRFVKDVFRLR